MPGETFLIIDALDQVPVGRMRDSYLLFIKRLADRKLANLHILISSRNHLSIRKSLDSCGTWTMIHLKRNEMKADMRSYVTKSIRNDDQLTELSLGTQEIIIKRLVDEGNGRLVQIELAFQIND